MLIGKTAYFICIYETKYLLGKLFMLPEVLLRNETFFAKNIISCLKYVAIEYP